MFVFPFFNFDSVSNSISVDTAQIATTFCRICDPQISFHNQTTLL